MSAPKTTSSLDSAWEAVLTDRTDDGVRQAIAILETDPDQLGAASLLLRALDAAGRSGPVQKHAKQVATSWAGRGELPQAVAVARLAGKEKKVSELLRSIAQIYGKGSARIGDVSAQPPPLPVSPELGDLAKLSGDALYARAEKALDGFAAWKDPVDPDAKVPALPLFSAMPPKALERLLSVTTIREYPTGAEVIAQGAEGKEAYVVVRGMLRAERTAGHGEPTTTLALLGPGAIFGEMALVSDAPRAAAVHAQEPTRLLAMSRADLEAIAKDEPSVGEELGRFCQARMIANLVRTSSILKAAAPEQRADLMARFTPRQFEAGEALVHEGAEVTSLFLIASGAVRVMKDENGEPLMLAELGPGEVVGEIGIVLRRPASATVLATHPTVALELTRDQFEDAIKSHPTLLGELYQLATAREEETRSIVAQDVMDLDTDVLL